LTTSGQQIDYPRIEEEINLLYHSCTKARVNLVTPEDLKDGNTRESLSYEEVILPETDQIDLSDKELPNERTEEIYTLNRMRNGKKNTFSKWTKEQDEDLLGMFKNETSVEDIAKKLQRSKSAISFRIKKLNKNG